MAKLDPQAQTLVDAWANHPSTPIHDLTAAMVRADDASVQALSGEAEDVYDIEPIVLPPSLSQVHISFYRPSDQPLPLLIYFHGGGFVIGPESYDIPLRSLANKTGCIIALVTCRLAPEHPYPAAVDDAYAAYLWLVSNAPKLNTDSTHIAIGGDSSGGNLAAVVSYKLKIQQERQPDFQLLIYPMLDAMASTASYQTFAHGFGFSKEKSLWYFDQYLPVHIDKRSAEISPYWQVEYAQLPATFVATAGCDPLRDEAEAYAERLELAGVTVTLKRYEGMIHGFFQMAGVLDKGRVLHKDIAIYVRQKFGILP
ncbi:MAG: alpha/beta hydrolase [Acidiferrobacterales bacterium]|nr:alpha/beta hydrolase [Acidiferrobacterales bacterium]